MRHVYLAATGTNRGKTTVALGLVAALIDRGLATGFIKPVGQRYASVAGVPADEDAILMKEALRLPDPLAVMSPVHIPRGFTKAYVRREVRDDLAGRVRAAHAQVARGREVVLIEGTGHAGVGSVIDLSNARVARLLGAPVIIVSEGGVGKPIDEIALNRSLFAREGVEVVGAIVNKVDIGSDPSLPDVLRRALSRQGIDLLGVLPYRPLLSRPTISMLVEQLEGELLSPGPGLDEVIEHVAVGAMQPRHVLERIGPGSLLIVPGDREDVVQAAVAASRTARRLDEHPGLLERLRGRSRFGRPSADPGRTELAGLLLTGGYRPRPRELDAIRDAGLFAYLVEAETYEAASRVHDLLVKTHPADREKIELIKRLAADHLDLDRILDRFGRVPEVTPAAGKRRGAVSALSRRLRDGLRGITGAGTRRA